MNHIFLSVLALLGGTSVVMSDFIRVVQKATGKDLDIELVNVGDEKVEFKIRSGATYTLNLSELTDESVVKIRAAKVAPAAASGGNSKKLSAKDAEKFKMLNEVIGHRLFGDVESLWSETAGEIAERLNWPLESKKKGTSSYRSYTRDDYQFLGAHPYCVTLYGGDEDAPEQFSLIFANKGDFGSTAGMGEDHFKKMHPVESLPRDLNEAIKLDEKLIKTELTKILGKPETQYYGEKEDKRKVERWDLKEHAFILSALEDEYTHLIIVSTEVADNEGKLKFITDREMKKLKLKNVQRDKNGDVWINNIPMVDQGPKGYCAPATFERAMRYMGIPADMYLLATLATEAGRGTDTMKLAEESKRIVRSKARKIRDLNLEDDFSIKELKKFIDEGVPVLWQMRSLGLYNMLANSRTVKRKSVTDMAKWAKEIKAEADDVTGKLGSESNHHICMVIGYNEETKEVAVSDSWGPQYEIRWVHVDIAKAVTSRGGFVIDF